MKSKINMQAIADHHNVSVVTVSKALNDKDGVSDELREKIKETAEKLGYRPNHAARSLKTQRNYNIGIMIANRFVHTQETYYFNVASEIIKKLSELGYSGLMEILMPEDEDAGHLPRMFLEQKVDGMIILGQMKNTYLTQLETIDIPLIYLDFYVDHSNVDSIFSDNFFSSYRITSKLLDQGHRSIGYIGNIFSTTSIQDRYLGYYKALLEHRIQPDPGMIINDRDDQGELIDLEIPDVMPTAFVANCDQIAHRFIRVLKEHGYSVPDDVSVVSFDNSIFSTISSPQITTVDNNVKEMVDTASRIIIKKIDNPQRTYGRVLIKGTIIERESARPINHK